MAITSNGLIQLGFTAGVDFRVEDDGSGAKIVSWTSESSQPSVADIEAADVTYNTEWDAQEYARKRKAEYPAISECVHAILDDDLVALQAKRTAVKNKYPKS